MPLDIPRIRQSLQTFDFRKLFVQELGWNRHAASLTVAVDGQAFNLQPIAEKRGFQVFECPPGSTGTVPDHPTRSKIERQVARSAHEHIIIYTDTGKTVQKWQWVRRELGRSLARREYDFFKGHTGELLAQKLQYLAVDLAEEERITLVDVTRRARQAFDVDRVTKRFYEHFKTEHATFLKFVKGITVVADSEWYASLMLNRLMFIYFIQKKGFLDNDYDYLRNRLRRVQAERGKDKFFTFYRYFLVRLFHEGLGQPPAVRKKELDKLLGSVPYLNGGLFDVHDLERAYPDIQIADDAFNRLFDFFDSYQWHLDERPLRADNEINPDVLGYIFEQYINQKQMGAYYTKEDITGYIARNTLIPFLFNAAEHKCAIAFRPDSALWRLLRDDPDRYIYPAMLKGVDQPLPPDIAQGISAFAKHVALPWHWGGPRMCHSDHRAWRTLSIWHGRAWHRPAWRKVATRSNRPIPLFHWQFPTSASELVTFGGAAPDLRLAGQRSARQFRTRGPTVSSTRFIRWFREIGLADVGQVGGKNASLGELYCKLTREGIRVPNGFAVTAEAYRYFLRTGGLEGEIQSTLTGLDTRDFAGLADRGRRLREAILSQPLPNDLRQEIVSAYGELCREYGPDTDTAVRSSATAEDLPGASFAGQQESFLNVRGERALLDAYRQCLASLFTDRAISYRVDTGFDHTAIALSVGVQKMVRSDLGTAGVLFTLDTETGFPDVVLINSAYGLGESVVKGRVDPDEFLVFKPTLKADKKPILKRQVGAKQEKLVYSSRGHGTKIVPVPAEERERLSLTDDEVLTLARWGCQIEDHYSAKAGKPTPMDIEWAKDGRTGELFILQARPETVHSKTRAASLEVYELQETGPVLLTGRSVGERIGAGPVRVARDVHHLEGFKSGEVLVADMTDPDWEPTMKMAGAIVTNRGGRTCHAAIVSREIGVPCVVGTERATALLRDGQQVTVSCAEGEVGRVYDGTLKFARKTIDLGHQPRPRTRVLINVGDPDKAFSLAALPTDGVGLAREEFIISSSIRIHPLALVHFDRLPDGPAKTEIARLTCRHPTKPDYFVEKLAEGVGRIAAAFYPKEVIVRLSDFKTNEYAGLLGGAQFEPTEENPMLGFRGASRYYDDRYRDGFLLECRAMNRVRAEMGLTNVKLMIPFCRTVEEGRKVLEVLAAAGLKRGEDGLEVYVMCEIPANVILAEAFAEIFDGFSIGSNDLTQLILGLDRDSEVVARLFDERNPAVMTSVEDVIRRVRACGRKIGICGQAPSDYPEFARFLVRCGIDSISLNPDTVLKTTSLIAQAETEFAGPPRAARRDDRTDTTRPLPAKLQETLT